MLKNKAAEKSKQGKREYHSKSRPSSNHQHKFDAQHRNADRQPAFYRCRWKRKEKPARRTLAAHFSAMVNSLSSIASPHVSQQRSSSVVFRISRTNGCRRLFPSTRNHGVPPSAIADFLYEAGVHACMLFSRYAVVDGQERQAKRK